MKRKSLIKLLIENIDKDVVNQVQSIVDENQYLKGTVSEESLIGSKKYVLWASTDGLSHIKERHEDKNKPGSLFVEGLDFRKVMAELLEMEPNELQDSKIKWIAIEMPSVTGYSGLSYASPEIIAQMKDYTMPDRGGGEVVKVSPGEREPTNYISLVTRNIGKLSDGRELLSLITFYPGANHIPKDPANPSAGVVEVPSTRSAFTEAGLYFSLPAESPILKQ